MNTATYLGVIGVVCLSHVIIICRIENTKSQIFTMIEANEIRKHEIELRNDKNNSLLTR